MSDLTTNTQKGPQSLRAVWPALVGLSAVFLFEMLDNTLLNVALPTIGRQLHASASSLQWVVNGYAVVFGGLMLVFGGIADRFGRRNVMLIGLALLAVASIATLFVQTVGELIALRVVMGVAAAMTTPGTMALSFRLFKEDKLRMRAAAVISSAGIIGIAIGPTVGGLALSVVSWQVLLVVNAPIAVLSGIAIRFGIPADTADDLHSDPIDVLGGLLGTLTIVLALVSPTLFVQVGSGSLMPWTAAFCAVAAATAFVIHERRIDYPLIDFGLVARPRVASGLVFQSALGLAMAGVAYTVTLQLQLAWGWSPALAAVGIFPMVVTMLAIGPFVDRIVDRFGNNESAIYGSITTIVGLLVYALFGRYSYVWIAFALVFMSAGMRVVMVTATVNVMSGLPKERTSIGAALSDTAQEVSNAIGVAAAGTVIAVIFSGRIDAASWTHHQVTQFENAVTTAILPLAAMSAVLVAWAAFRSRSTN